jgi:hypothetical protein
MLGVPGSGERAGVDKPKEIIDRDTEWRELQAAWETAHLELILVLGWTAAAAGEVLCCGPEELLCGG